jgi:4-hydroxy 2-oxovalerate aldolase
VKAPWITCRPEIKVLDCTVRDGGLINDHRFDETLVKAVYTTCVDAGIDYMEIGYKNAHRLFAKDQFGAWKFSDEADIRRIVGDNPTPLKLSVMMDAGKSDWRTDLQPKKDSVIDVIRVACYIHQIPEAVDMIKAAADRGYETTCNIMAISTAQEPEIDQALEILRETPVGTIVVVDSNGALYAEQVEILVKKYKAALDGTGKEVGIHAHNNLQLGFANTIEAIIHGANRIDATMAGMGRGAGNCPMELLLGFLKNPKFNLRPVLKLLQDYFVNLRDQVEWGPLVQYNITGQMNQHPRTAIWARAGKDRNNYVDFYDRCVGDE